MRVCVCRCVFFALMCCVCVGLPLCPKVLFLLIVMISFVVGIALHTPKSGSPRHPATLR